MRAQRTRRLAGIALLMLALGLGAVAWRDTTRPALGEVTVPVSGLSREVTILHVSDLHSEVFGERQALISDLLGEQRFDAIVVNGDLVASFEADPAPAEQLLEVLAPHSDTLVFSRGNHDPESLLEEIGASDAAWLNETTDTVAVAPDAGSVLIATPTTAEAIPRATDCLVLVSHDTMTAQDIATQDALPADVRLYLFGHTHGGQIRLPLIGAIWAPEPCPLAPHGHTLLGGFLPDLRGRYVRGVYDTPDGAYVHVSPGLGTHRLRVRLFDRAELTIVRLVPTEQ